jgi:dienelactone hydrolase
MVRFRTLLRQFFGYLFGGQLIFPSRTAMRPALALMIPLFLARAAVPENDARQTEVAGFKTHFTLQEYTSREQWEDRKEHLRQQILSAAGLLPLPRKGALNPKVVRHFYYPDYTIEAVLIETLPGYYLGGNLYRPRNRNFRMPGVLVPHGHWKRGRLENLPSYSVPALGINLARQGYVVFAYDMAGYNDTRQTPHGFGGWAETLWSFNPMGLQLWNSIRALDYLQSLPDVDPQHIAATGASGGATQTFLLAAVDDRGGFAAPVNMVSAYMQGGDPCEEAPGLRLDTFNVEITAMMAPRPMLIVSTSRDWTRHTPTEEFPAIRGIYRLYGLTQNVQNAHFAAEHNYNRQSREAVYRFLAKYLRPGLPDEDMLALPKGDLPAGVIGLPGVFRAWKSTSPFASNIATPEETRESLRYAMGVEWPAGIEGTIQGNRVLATRPGKGDRVTGLWFPGEGDPILVVHPGGSAAALKSEALPPLLQTGRPIMVLEPFASGSLRMHRQRWDDYFLSYNRTDAADRVQDILTALAYLESQSVGLPTLVGLKEAGVWCVFAAAVAPPEVEVMGELGGFTGTDEDFRDRFFVPGIQRAGGLTAALQLIPRLRPLTPSLPLRIQTEPGSHQ